MIMCIFNSKISLGTNGGNGEASAEQSDSNGLKNVGIFNDLFN